MLSGPVGLAGEPVVQLLSVVLQPPDVDPGPLQSLLHGQRRWAEAGGASVPLHELLQLGQKKEEVEDTDVDRDGTDPLRPVAAPQA